VIAGTSPAPGGNEAALVPADQVAAFLKANNVTPVDGAKADAKASVLRIVCVRK
jgi:hypothetical protein